MYSLKKKKRFLQSYWVWVIKRSYTHQMAAIFIILTSCTSVKKTGQWLHGNLQLLRMKAYPPNQLASDKRVCIECVALKDSWLLQSLAACHGCQQSAWKMATYLQTLTKHRAVVKLEIFLMETEDMCLMKCIGFSGKAKLTKERSLFPVGTTFFKVSLRLCVVDQCRPFLHLPYKLQTTVAIC